MSMSISSMINPEFRLKPVLEVLLLRLQCTYTHVYTLSVIYCSNTIKLYNLMKIITNNSYDNLDLVQLNQDPEKEYPACLPPPF